MDIDVLETQVKTKTFGELVQFLLESSQSVYSRVGYLLTAEQDEIKKIMPGLPSDVIACCVKLMNNNQLVEVGKKIFNPLPDSNLGMFASYRSQN